ncbi:Nuclear pore complex nucleoporin component [Coemansia brasiliensis]|uniref:mRNA export factor GLE1 n=1 Tax=Coemansia brasiliensis TaxID=2650707 RepID=A0A9W8IBB2_9FUNG|nr:Nuclear pore complex nucleoporin component [Coemansia brasiliensis]
MIRWVKNCPFVIPGYISKSTGQSTNNYLKVAGYKHNDNDELDSECIYSERMAGMLALFAVIVQTPDVGGQPNPFSIHHAWTWLARIINMAPQAISPLLVQTFLSIAGTAMLDAYGSQTHKLLQAIYSQWLPKLTDTSPLAKAGKSNLTTFLEEYLQSGKIRECEGRNIKTR